MFDMNGSKDGTVVIMHVSDDYSKFYLVDANGIKFGNCDGYDFFSMELTDVSSIQNLVEDYYSNIITKGNITIKTVDDRILKVVDGKISGDLDYDEFIIASDSQDTQTGYTTNLQIDSLDTLQVIFESDDTEFSYYDNNNTYYYEIAGSGVDAASVDVKSNVFTFTGSKWMNFNAKIATDSEVAEGEEGLISVSGKTDGTVTLSAEDGKVKLHSDNPISDLTIASYVGNDMITETVVDTDHLDFTVSDGGKPEITETQPEEIPTNNMSGDVTGDDVINAKDANAILIAAAKIGTGNSTGLTAEKEAAADVNDDGTINAKDANIVLRYAAAVGTGQKVSIKDFI